MNGNLHFDFVRNFGLCSGDIADLQLATVTDNSKKTQVLMKIARDEKDNDLLLDEANTLRYLNDSCASDKKCDRTWSFCIPKLYDSFEIKDENGGPKPHLNLLEFFPGFVSVEDIRKLSTGVDGRTLVWMWKRILGVLSWVHHFKYVHGALLPPHILFWPDGTKKDERTHSIRIVDWAYAANYETQKNLKAWVPDYGDFYPQEILEKRLLVPASDLYMGAATMLYLAGGDVRKQKFPTRIPPQIIASIKKCLAKDWRRRPQSAGDLLTEFAATAKDVYGANKFHEFKLAI